MSFPQSSLIFEFALNVARLAIIGKRGTPSFLVRTTSEQLLSRDGSWVRASGSVGSGRLEEVEMRVATKASVLLSLEELELALNESEEPVYSQVDGLEISAWEINDGRLSNTVTMYPGDHR